MEALGFCAMAHPFSSRKPRRRASFAAPPAGKNCRWLKALSDKKGYHGSLPVPSVAPHACYVHYGGASAVSFQAKAARPASRTTSQTGQFGK
jgi:hypothetical protein